MRKLSVMVAILVAMFFGSVAYACPKEPDCKCGEVCKMVKVCKVYKYCKKNCKTPKCKWWKALVCHVPPGNPGNAHNICVSWKAVKAHLALHGGDYLGPCECTPDCTYNKCCKYVKKCECKPCPPADAGPPPEPDQGPPPVVPDQGPPPVDPDQGPCPGCPDQGPPPADPDRGVPPVEPDGAVVQPDAGPPVVQPDMKVVAPDAEVVETDGPCTNCPDGFKEEKQEDLEMVGGGCAMASNGTSSGWLGGAMLIGFLAFVIGSVRKTWLLVLVSIFLISGTAFAYDNDYKVTQGGKTLLHLQPELGIMFDYERRPVEIVKKKDGASVTDVIEHRTTMSLSFNMGLFDRFELGLMLPLELSQKAAGLDYLGKDNESSLQSGIGDFEIMPKARLLTKGPFHLGLIVPVALPTTNYDTILGTSGPSVAPQAVFELDTRYFDMALNAGYKFVGDESMKFRQQSIIFDDAIVGSFGIKIALWEHKIEVFGDSFVSVPIDEQDKEEIPVVALGGFKFYLPGGFQADIGAGAGLTKGVGAPTYRLFAGVTWSPLPDPKPKVVERYIVVPKVIRSKCPPCPTPIVCKTGTVVIPPVFFDFDKDYLTATSVPVMLKIVEIIKKNPQVKRVVLHGHTDSKGSVKYNDGLAARRAEHVLKFLLKHDIHVVRTSRSWSELKPYTSNKTKDGRAQNRRVEFEIVR